MYEEGQLCSDCGAWMRMTHTVAVAGNDLYVYQCTNLDCNKVLLGYVLFRITPIHEIKPCPECNNELEFQDVTDDGKTIFICKNEYGKHKVTVESINSDEEGSKEEKADEPLYSLRRREESDEDI